MVTTLRTPQLVGSRGAARTLLADLPADCSTGKVTVDCTDLRASSPSFVDELVKNILVDRAARQLKLQNAPVDVAGWANDSAQRRNVAERLMVDVRLS